jgi:hypothetical protein
MTAKRTASQNARAEPVGIAGFPVSPDSPFADGYDIASERDALADLMASEHPDPADPRWSRLMELREREAELRRPRQPAPAPSAVPPVASPAARLGQLEDATPDTMTLHTKDAYGLFSGRPADNPARLPPIPGGRRFAAVLKSIWHLSANDNPYADWVLIRMYDALVGIRANLARVIAAREEGMEVLKRKGLSISVMASRSPKTVELGFRSPYGGGDRRLRLLRAHGQNPHSQGPHERRGGPHRHPWCRAGNSRAFPRSDSLGTQSFARGAASIESQ